MGSVPLPDCVPLPTGLRNQLIDQIKIRYKEGYDEVVPLNGLWSRLAKIATLYDEAMSGRAGLEFFLGKLTDAELLQAFERQCCQKYR
jgi:hypothetical protein